MLFELIAHRYERATVIIPSNQAFADWDQIFPDAMMTVAAVDRLVHHATIIEIGADSYRRKQALNQFGAESGSARPAPASTTMPASKTPSTLESEPAAPTGRNLPA
ncbi:ATP-binding protein [Thiorhodovibrio litoralis]|uniref:ATP-binding protein n=1 Tax=Thiorhodovibrio litoralis TaxID=2952932 RepID=UPI001914C426|nr:hypothetical protein [Thiorhodovibrio winogradskyi]WPL13677.1 transposase [Thiorhodovibrio litoralis]